MTVLATLDATTVLVGLLGGGFLTGLAALLKFKPEKDAVVVSAAQGAVVVQSGVIDALQDELRRARDERDSARRDLQDERKLRIEAELRLRDCEDRERRNRT